MDPPVRTESKDETKSWPPTLTPGDGNVNCVMVDVRLAGSDYDPPDTVGDPVELVEDAPVEDEVPLTPGH